MRWELRNNHGLFEWVGVYCPRCGSEIALYTERFKGGGSSIMRVCHLQTNSARCPKEVDDYDDFGRDF